MVASTRLGSKRAVSTVIATVLMINVALVSGILVYSWANGLFGKWTAITRTDFQLRGEMMEEAIALVNVRFDSEATYKLNITIVNVGQRDAWIASIYLNGSNLISQTSLAWDSRGIIVAQGNGSHVGTYHLLVGSSVTFAFRQVPPSLSQGRLLSLAVTTTRGSRVVQEWKISG